MEVLTFSIIIGVGFIVSLLIGAVAAKLLGFRLNEPEYYDLQDRLTKRNKDNDTL
jgi:uncharacterized membrane-anchored protein YhcB (DUF1043 family)